MTTKAGRRNSTADQQHLQQAHDHTVQAGAMCAPAMDGKSVLKLARGLRTHFKQFNYSAYGEIMDVGSAARLLAQVAEMAANEAMEQEPDQQGFNQCLTVMRGVLDFLTHELGDAEAAATAPLDTEDDMLVGYGKTIKALGGGKVGGYLVQFSTENDPDLAGDFFTKSTEYGVEDGDRLSVYYHHGMDADIGTRRVGRGTVKIDDVGVWLEAQLAMRDDYEKQIYAMAEAGKLGWSSGAAAHLVEREPVGKAYHIKLWQLAEASLTPTPAEPRTRVVPLKSLTAAMAVADEVAPSGHPSAQTAQFLIIR